MTALRELPPPHVRAYDLMERKESIEGYRTVSLDRDYWFKPSLLDYVNMRMPSRSREFGRIRRNLDEQTPKEIPLAQRLLLLDEIAETAAADQGRQDVRAEDIDIWQAKSAPVILAAAERTILGPETRMDLPSFASNMAGQMANAVARAVAWENTYDLEELYGKHNPHMPIVRLFERGDVHFTSRAVREPGKKTAEKLIIHAPVMRDTGTVLACITEDDANQGEAVYYHGWTKDCSKIRTFPDKSPGRVILPTNYKIRS